MVRYAVAVGLTVLATLGRLVLDHWLGAKSPFLLYPVAIAASARYGGFRAGIVATALAGLIGAGFLLAPQPNGWIDSPGTWTSLVALVLSGVALSWLCESMQDVRRRIEREVRKRLSAVLQEGTRKHTPRVAKETAKIGIYDYRPTSDELWWDDRCRALWGLSSDAPVTMDFFWKSMHFDDVAPTRSALVAAMEPDGGGRFIADFRIRPKDGPERWIRAIANVYFDGVGDDRTAVRVVGTVQDVTLERNAEAALRESEERFRALTHAVPSIIFEDDPERGNTFVSDRWVELTGLSRAETAGVGWMRAVHPEDAPMAKTRWQESLRTGTPLESRLRYRTRDGSYRWFLVRSQPVKNAEGRAIRWVGSCTDIHELRKVEEAMRESEERFRLAAEAVNGLIYDFDVQRGSVWRSRKLKDLLGFEPREVEPTSTWWSERIHPDDKADHHQRVSRLHTGDGSFADEYRIRHRDGHYIHVWERGLLLRDVNGTPLRVVGCTVDVTAQRRAERDLRSSERSLRALFDADPNGIVVAEPHTCGIVLFNDEAARQLGYTRDEFRRLSLAELDTGDDHIALCSKVRLPYDASGAEFETRLKTKEGRSIDTLVKVRRVQMSGGPMLLVIFQDITVRKVAEEALKDADRKKDGFIALLAHELRNPLAPIRSAVDILKVKEPLDPQLHWCRDVIDRQVAQMAHLLDDLLDVSRITLGKLVLRKERVLLTDVLTLALETCEPLIEQQHHDLVVEIPDMPVQLDADPTRLGQVIANLLNNAAKYTDRGGVLRLVAKLIDGSIEIRVADTGIGIAADKLAVIFEPFAQIEHSLNKSQGGLGIGLMLVRRLVEMHGGTVSAASDGLEKGSTFVVRLPLPVQTPVELPVEPKAPPEAAPVEPCRILLVDDNVDAADSLAIILRFAGHDVRVVHDGQAGITAASEFRPDVILLDLGMPRLNGFEACRQIRELSGGGDITIIALTGWGQDEDRRRTREAGFDHHLVKPVEPETLMRLIAESRKPAVHS
jgi:PAS domain S-box-containing protein